MNSLRMDLGNRSYDIHVGKGLLARAGELLNLNRRVFILTDAGVPKEYAACIQKKARDSMIFTVAEGEGSKSMKTLETVLQAMMEFDITRFDALVSVGGGVVGDLGGFAAATYMRGIDFYQVPTTLLAQVDSSIGGKCAINLGGTKNIIGAFYQPKCVLIDTETLATLQKRQIAAGLAESVKMSLTSDAALFSVFEREGMTKENLEDIILRSLMIKKSVVEADERESDLRKILNFGHTLGHGIEAQMGMADLYHGECVALGMLPMCSAAVRGRLLSVLEKLGLPVQTSYDTDKALEFVIHDKKCANGMVDAIFVDTVGTYRIEKMTIEAFGQHVKKETII